MKNLMKEDSTYIAGTYKRFPIHILVFTEAVS